jgi:hypothetical protein
VIRGDLLQSKYGWVYCLANDLAFFTALFLFEYIVEHISPLLVSKWKWQNNVMVTQGVCIPACLKYARIIGILTGCLRQLAVRLMSSIHIHPLKALDSNPDEKHGCHQTRSTTSKALQMRHTRSRIMWPQQIRVTSPWSSCWVYFKGQFRKAFFFWKNFGQVVPWTWCNHRKAPIKRLIDWLIDSQIGVYG